ncbi:DUF1805 domain-containing protein [Candidatus Bathyarchaeota archaeon]|nr:MAG: DUF1805 domain-containing protein [Candidatus Bathyarchaeota archaeon]
MINVTSLKIDDKVAIGLEVELPDSPTLLMIIGQTGFVMCGFLNMGTAEILDVAAAMVSGVRNFDDVLGAEIKAATSKVQIKGIKVGMKRKETVKLLFRSIYHLTPTFVP